MLVHMPECVLNGVVCRTLMHVVSLHDRFYAANKRDGQLAARSEFVCGALSPFGKACQGGGMQLELDWSTMRTWKSAVPAQPPPTTTTRFGAAVPLVPLYSARTTLR
jgi:hypothetical protein